MCAEPAGKETVAVCNVDDIARPSARGADRARDQACPDVEIVRSVAHYRGLPGRAARGVDAQYLLARHREHAEGICGAEIFFAGEGEPREIAEIAKIVGMNVLPFTLLAEMRDVVIGVAERRLEPPQLQRG